MKLVLFDIDGTLLHADGQGRAAIERGLSRCLGEPVSTDNVDFGGRTDLEILQHVLRRYAPDRADRGLLLQEAMQAFVEAGLEQWNDDRVRALPGVPHLLNRLEQRDDVTLGLVTGNCEAIAHRKLASVGLGTFFEFGAYGSERESRVELLNLALDRAGMTNNYMFRPRDARVIGDTTRDIIACREVGIPCIAVSTGPHSYDVLAREKPAYLFSSLANTPTVEAAIFSSHHSA
jgi:phosphoglycolate phosphatase-like HAD superfamily hydrolase